MNTTIDPLFENALTDNNTDENTARKNKEKGDDVITFATNSSGLEISVEDRAIGRVSSKLYWNYFISGIHSFLIIGTVIPCLITQGES